ncbi:MAG: ABC transporter ATP-binding protein/permease [Bacilli bacterium]|nr:ABC transporter ATP-binding protein/permease [Bacilli bacterium]
MKNIKKFWPYLKGSKGLALISLICASISTLAKLAIPYVAGLAINVLTEALAKGVTSVDISAYLIIIACCCVVGALFRYLFDFSTAVLGQRVIKNMRKMVFASYNDAPISYIDKNQQGNLVLRLVNDVENVQNGLVSGFAAFYDGAIAIVITIIFMFMINWVLGLIVIGLTPVSIFTSRAISKFNAKHFKSQAKAAGEMTGFALESLNNSETVQTLGIKEGREKEFDEFNKRYRDNIFKANMGASTINPSTRLVNAIINACLVTVGSILIIKHANIGIYFAVGNLSAFLTYAANYMQPFNEISDVIAEIDYAFASFHRIDEAINAPKDINEGEKIICNEIDDLSAKNITFSYDGKRDIIKDFSLDIYKGHRIALVGPTGCGKTTLINLLLRFYDPQKGAFYANQVSTQDLEKIAFRSHIGMVLQETWIFDGTIYENIAYAKPDATLEEVRKAAEKAQALGFIERLPDGFETRVSDSSGLSIGEKQLLCVARVMLLEPEIVILDEATSNIDIRTEALLSKSFAALMEGKTSLVVAHRISTIVNSDLIVVLKDGEIIEQGNHQELMEKKGFYYSLFNAQFN